MVRVYHEEYDSIEEYELEHGTCARNEEDENEFDDEEVDGDDW